MKMFFLLNARQHLRSLAPGAFFSALPALGSVLYYRQHSPPLESELRLERRST